jgi:Arylsulfotransferase (ASST)
VAGIAPAAAAAGAPTVTISPLPGTEDASARTQVSFLGAPAEDIQHVSVVGSHSGSHDGRMAAYSTGDGASFLPRHPFVAGELVRVHARVVVGHSARTIASQFRIAHQVRVPGGDAVVSRRARAAASTAHSVQSFRSRPDLKAPRVFVTAATPQAAPGYVFITPTAGPAPSGPMIFDDSGQLVWFKPLSHYVATNLQVQAYEGKPVLTWWQGHVLSLGFGQGEDIVYDDSYQQVAVVRAGNGYMADLHAFRITPRGTALMTVFDPVRANLSSVHGPRDGQVLDGVIQEVDIKTGLVMWEWHSLHHVALTDSHAQPRADTPLDYFHINSIEQLAGGNLLISARNTWASYAIRQANGALLWRLGGRHSSFKMGSGTGTAYQHDARMQPDGTITLFDDGAAPKVHSQSRAVRIALDYRHRTARLVGRYVHSSPLLSGSQGDTQVLGDGNVFVGWGEEPIFSEFSSEGALVFDARIPAPADSYRAFRFPWSGHPAHAPALSVAAGAGRARTVYASWNGATGVASWQVLSGPSPTTLTPVASAARTGFETAISVAALGRCVAVRALDASGAVLGTSMPATS